MTHFRVFIMMTLTALFWAGAFITGKFGVQEFPPSALTFFRFLFALPLIFAILYIRQPKEWIPRRRQLPWLFLMGLLGTFGYHILFFTSLKYTLAMNSALINATNPMVTVVLSVLFLKENLSPARIGGVLLALFGVALIITNGDVSVVSGLRFNFGDLMQMIGTCSWAAYAVIGRKSMQDYAITPLMMTAYSFLFGTLLAAPLALFWDSPAAYLPQATLRGWLSILYMTVFASVLGYLFQLIAIQTIGAPKAAVFINLVPVFTIAGAFFILGEPVTLLKLMSAAVVICGVCLTIQPGKREANP